MENESKIEIATAANAEQFAAACELFREYAAQIGVDLCFQNFETELENLETIYAAPTGALLLSLCGEQIAGCVAVRKLEADICEMRRLYVKPEFRRLKIGAKLIAAVVERAGQLGYERMRLDTLPTMTRAQDLYRSFGFREIAAYRYNPDPDTAFMELKLSLRR